MIKATEAKKVTAEAQAAKKKQQTLEEARQLEKLFKVRMAETDKSVKAAMMHGDDSIRLDWDHSQLPQALRERFEKQVKDDIEVHPNDDGEGWEVIINWKEI